MAIGTLEPDDGWTARLSSTARAKADAMTRERNSLDLAGLVRAWAKSVGRIVSDNGEDYYDDYYIYILWREGIDQIVAALPPADAEIVRSAIARADTEFRNHTVDDGGRALSGSTRSGRNGGTGAGYRPGVPSLGPWEQFRHRSERGQGGVGREVSGELADEAARDGWRE